jgi:Ca2+-binding RTX toxin-like protein
MANLVAGSVKISNALFPTEQLIDGELLSATSTKVVIETYSAGRFSFSGNFTYTTDDPIPSGGTVTKFQDSFGLTLDRISISATKLVNDIFANRSSTILNYVFASNDTIAGSNYSDTLYGYAGGDSLFGRGGNDIINGGAGNDIIIGGSGNDTLTGGTGADRFRFNAVGEKLDRITDFNVVDDTLVFSAAGFDRTLTANAVLSSSRFVLGTAAKDNGDRFIYNKSNGALFFDADGIGAAAKVQIATLNAGLNLTHADFNIVA